MKIRIGVASLYDIAEKACKVYRKELAEAEFFCDIECIYKSLADVMKLWDVVNDFDLDDEIVLTLEKREEREYGTDHAD